ncbi:alginate lyase family protein [Shewanella sp. 3_MG-2023]|uniref:heparinase II/III family protein n=1 Tax=Shewanella sp. 3_MG-2023 TaxID=3062635 RepID=UPI0026E458B3|nr:alginate lyase family protein [Shewanella sp. 3_MG-2023]MDO6776590.1 alginate lyase family protein [Shewanella sp. 3_MG-2023]
MLKVIKLYNTVKYLRFEQVFFRLLYRFKKPKVHLLTIPLSSENWNWNGPAIFKQSIFDKNRVEFLSLAGSVDSIGSWNDPAKEKLWLYNLHYFDDLNSSDYLSRKKLHINFINKWVLENPACIGNGWEPYPLSLRLVNWVKWFSKQGEVEQKYLGSMLQQADVLSQQLEFHILGNHLFANAKALTFIGCYIADKHAECYLDLGLKLLDREIPEQFLPDGAHFELSPMYHEILLWDLLELIDLANTSQHIKLLQRLPYWEKVATKALFWLKSMIHPDGEVSFFNDSAIGIAAKPQQLFDYAISLGLKITDDLPSLITNEHSGYSRVSSYIYTLIVDHANVGPDYLPGHAHADTLSFELSVGCERVFVNSGTSLYGVSKERLRQRQTAAHNTVVVDGEDSSEVWSGFRVARRAYSNLLKVSQHDNSVFLQATHDGYHRLKGKVTHSRSFATSQERIQIKDELIGQVNQACAFFHLHPTIAVEIVTDYIVRLVTESNVKLSIHSTSKIEILDGTYHPEFGVCIDNKNLKMDLVDNQLNTIISIIED